MSTKNAMRAVHPGEVLREELEALDMSAKAFSEALRVPGNRITMILKGQRGITADTALRLSRYLGTTAEFWLNLQKTYELRLAQKEAGEQIIQSVKPRKEAA
jgi:addiction module HigA family antidote